MVNPRDDELHDALTLRPFARDARFNFARRFGFPDTQKPLSRRHFGIAIAVICIIGLLLRLPTLTRSLWLDEAYSAWFTTVSLHEIWTQVPLYDVHPPFYYTVLKGWAALFGSSEAALRGLSVIASLSSIVTLALSGRVLHAGAIGDRVALLGAFFLAINEGNIDFAQQARPYALETLTASIAILSALALVRRLHAEARSQPLDIRPFLPAMLALGISSGITMWLHNTALLIVCGLWSGLFLSCICIGSARFMLRIGVIGGAGAIALLVWAPCIAIILKESTALHGSAFWVTFTGYDLASAWSLISGGYLALPFVTTFSLVGLVALWRTRTPSALLLGSVLLLPFTAAALLSYFIKPFFLERLFEWMSPAVMGLTALGLLVCIRQRITRLMAIASVAYVCLFWTYQYYMTPKEDWRSAIQTVLADTGPNDLVIGTSSEISLPFDYYARDTGKKIVFIPAPYPAMNASRTEYLHFGSPIIIDSDRAQVQSAIEGRSRVWLLERRPDYFDPDDIVQTELAKSFEREKSFGNNNLRVSLFTKR